MLSHVVAPTLVGTETDLNITHQTACIQYQANTRVAVIGHISLSGMKKIVKYSKFGNTLHSHSYLALPFETSVTTE